MFGNQYVPEQIAAVSTSIRMAAARSGRQPMVYSLSPGNYDDVDHMVAQSSHVNMYSSLPDALFSCVCQPARSVSSVGRCFKRY